MGAIITFSASLVAIALLLFLKDWELRHRTKLFFVFRARLDATVTEIASHLSTKTPGIAAQAATEAKVIVRHGLALSIHSALVRLERLLERTLKLLRYQRIKTTRAVSPFLESVAEHKRSLDKSKI